MKAVKSKKSGWKSMPISFKIFFVLFIMTIFFPIFSVLKALGSEFSFLGILLPAGILTPILVGIIFIGGKILRLVCMWKKSSWMYKYLLIFGSFLMVNGLLSIIHLRRMYGFFVHDLDMFKIFIIAIILLVLFEGLFLFFVHKNRTVFKKT